LASQTHHDVFEHDDELGSSPDSSLHRSIALPSPFFPAGLDGSADKRLPRPITGDGAELLPPVPLQPEASSVLEDDEKTPDSWIPRDSRMVRLTGKHPFNCEPKLEILYDHGFLTPSSLFYVRSHGAVPRIDQAAGEAWTLKVHGLVANPVELRIADLKSRLETVTLPVTFVCAGNRRKEQNIVQKSLGFNWGAAGLATALFTGVYLSDLLDLVRPTKGAKHVVFEGADNLPNGPYGTSQRLSWARDKSKGMLVAWAANGLPLSPDHGYPLRMVIPGQIGGRSVKWLRSIEVSERESQHYLHFNDNKLLPTEYTPDRARADKDVWRNPAYIINELNVNSAIAYPKHDEVIDCSGDGDYRIRGYAYAGGGRRIERVEVSLDAGKTWLLAECEYPEDLYRAVALSDPVYGRIDLTESDRNFCWMFWSYTVPVKRLGESSSIMVRAMDESLALQPAEMYVNATGMMNNWWFRMAIVDAGNSTIRCEAPTMAGVVGGGWMQRKKDAGEDFLHPTFETEPADAARPIAHVKPIADVSMVKEGVTRVITRAELEAHNKAEEPWFAVNGQVYDGTAFLKGHPGGGESIQLVAGEDASEDFMAIHSSDAKLQLRDYHIGSLEGADEDRPVVKSTEPEPIEPVFLHKSKWKAAKLVEKTRVSHDSRLYRFALQSPDQELGLPCGQHVYCRLRRKEWSPNGKYAFSDAWVQRAYTPVSPADAKGFIDLLIKVYLPSGKFAGGRMTTGFDELELGDTIELKGPLGSFVWKGKGIACWRGIDRPVKKIGLISAGSGITPILQVLRGVLHDAEDSTTKLFMVNSNKEVQDILCREELDALAQDHAHRFSLHHTLSKPPSADWAHSKGRVTLQMLRQHLPPPDQDTLVLLCGPEQMQEETVKPALAKLGYDIETQLVVF